MNSRIVIDVFVIYESSQYRLNLELACQLAQFYTPITQRIGLAQNISKNLITRWQTYCDKPYF